MTPEQVLEWIRDGPPCMNCGESVPDAVVGISEAGVIFQGMCKSEVCSELPPGGNPFSYMLSGGE